MEQELRNADLAFQEERKIHTIEIVAAQHTIGVLQHELRNTTTRLDAQGAIVQDVASIGGELREARKDMALQAAEMREMGDMTDEMMGHVENLTTAFHQIDAEQQKGNIVNPNVVKSTPVHVRGTISDVKEPAEHVQTVPNSVINLMSGESEKQEQPVRGRNFSEIWVDIDDPHPPVMTSSQMAEQSGEKAAPTLFGIPGQIIPPYDQRNAANDDANRPTLTQETERQRVIVNSPPKLPSGTQKAIENIVQAHMERLGINARSQQENQGERESMAGNVPNPGPETSQFSFPDLRSPAASTGGQRQVFATAQWRPKEPPVFTGNTSDDVYLWTSLVRQYLVFMDGTARQEVAFAATLLRGAAHEWYRGYEQRNGNKPPQDWSTMQQAILDRFGSNIRAQEAHAKLLTISQGKRSVRDYTSEFEMLLGRLSTRDEATWKNMYMWGLQPHLAEAVALKYPTTIAQAAGHAEEIELAKKASHRPNLGAQGARPTGQFSGRGGSQSAPQTFAQGRGRGNVGIYQRGRQGQGGRRGGRWNRGRQGGSTTTQARTGIQCFNCGQYGHYASQCPRVASTSGSSGTAQSVNQRSTFAQNRGNRNGRGGNRRGGGNRRTRFSGLTVVYDAEGNEYPVDEDGNLTLDFFDEEDAAASQQNEQRQEN